MTTFYISIAVFGYMSQGDSVQPYILDSYKDAPQWVIDLANAMVLIHMLPAYQLWSQPHFMWLELMAERSPTWPKALGPKFLRYGYRSLYVCLITFIASEFFYFLFSSPVLFSIFFLLG